MQMLIDQEKNSSVRLHIQHDEQMVFLADTGTPSQIITLKLKKENYGFKNGVFLLQDYHELEILW